MTITIDMLVLVFLAVGTSIVTALTGVGGGTILIGLMPLFLPAAAIIPVHGAVQLASNMSRAYFSWSFVQWRYVYPFAMGALLGAGVFGFLVRQISLEWISLFIALYILLGQWSKTFNRLMSNVENFYAIGFLQMGMVLFVGAAGPMHMPLLLKKYTNPHQAVTVASVMMCLVHGAKIGVYVFLGFSFVEYGVLIGLLIAAAILGSYIGTRMRAFVSKEKLTQFLPYILSIIACTIIVKFIAQSLQQSRLFGCIIEVSSI